MNGKTYNEEMFDYLTQKDNYELAIELAQNITTINVQLKNEFWEKVTNELERKVKNQENIDGNQLDFIREDYWFRIEIESWKYCVVAGGFQTIGIKLKDSFNNIKETKKVIEVIVQDFKVQVIKNRDLLWICQDVFTERLFPTNIANNEIKKILPSRREEEINAAVNEYYSSIEKWILICNTINKKLGETN